MSTGEHATGDCTGGDDKKSPPVDHITLCYEDVKHDVDCSSSSSSKKSSKSRSESEGRCRTCFKKRCTCIYECGVCLGGFGVETKDWVHETDFRGWIKRTVTLDNLRDFLPVTRWLPKYRFKHFQGDIVAGLTVALTILPQSLGYAKLAKLPSQYGLYTSFMCMYMYLLFGTAKDLSLGPAAVMSLMTGRYAESPIEGDPTYAIVLSLMCGAIQFAMGVLHLGFIVDFFSQPVVHSFTTASVITIITSQIPNWLGLKDIPEDFLESVIAIFEKLPETRWQDFVLGLICIIFLVFMKFMKEINCWKSDGKQSKKQKAFKYIIWLLSIARNAIVVFATMGLVAIFQAYDMSPFSMPDPLPEGLPPFKPPAFSVSDGNTTYYASDIFSKIGVEGFIVVPLIGLVEAVAIAKAFARKNKYQVIPNQELFALGISNIMGSFVSAYPVTASFSRSSVNGQSGVKTTGGGFYTGTFVILVLAFMTPLFSLIPEPALAAVIITAVSDMAEFQLIIELWYTKRWDFFIWWLSFIVGLCFGIEKGLIVGCLVSAFLPLYHAARPKVGKMVVAGDSEDGKDIDAALPTISRRPTYVILTPHQGLLFPSVEYFKEKVLCSAVSENSASFRSIILDFRHIVDIDFTTMHGVNQLFEDFHVMESTLVICEMRPHVEKLIKKAHMKNFKFTNTVSEAEAFIRVEESRRCTIVASGAAQFSQVAVEPSDDVRDSLESDRSKDDLNPDSHNVQLDRKVPLIDGVVNDSFQF